MTRSAVAGVLLALLVATGGCTGVFSGPVAFSASKATVSDAALQQTGYDHDRTEKLTASRTFSVAGRSKEVEVTNWVSEYHRSAEIPSVGQRRVAVFTAFASPQVEVLGRSFNPLSKYGERELAQRFADRLKRVENLREVGRRNVTMLGRTTTVTEFAATVTTAGGVEFEAAVHVTKVRHDGDFVVALGVHPRRLDGEQATVDRLIRGVEHGDS